MKHILPWSQLYITFLFIRLSDILNLLEFFSSRDQITDYKVQISDKSSTIRTRCKNMSFFSGKSYLLKVLNHAFIIPTNSFYWKTNLMSMMQMEQTKLINNRLSTVRVFYDQSIYFLYCYRPGTLYFHYKLHIS